MDLVDAIRVGGLDAMIYFRLKITMRHKYLVGFGCDDEPIADAYISPIHDLPQIGHLSPHLIYHVPVNIVEGNDKRPLASQSLWPDQGVDL